MKAGDCSVHVHPDKATLFVDAAERIVEIAAQCVRERGRFTVALSGGATPNGVYALLATKPFRSRIGWSDVHVFWGDERCVAPEDPRSNYRAVYELLLSQVPVPGAHIHRMEGDLEPSVSAARYEACLREHFGTRSGAPRFTPGANFDLVLLGVGTDGHTASLFPDGSACREETRWTVAEYPASAATWRITLTLPLINAASRVMMLVAGTEKRAIMGQLLSKRGRSKSNGTIGHHALLPAQLVQPAEGELTWLLDAAAMPVPSPD